MLCNPGSAGSAPIVVAILGAALGCSGQKPPDDCVANNLGSGTVTNPCATGGAAATGGAMATGGTTTAGGVAATSGVLATGGTMTTGGAAATGGVTATGGGTAATCQPGYADCDGIAANGCEVNLTNDANNCGACNLSCNGAGCYTYYLDEDGDGYGSSDLSVAIELCGVASPPSGYAATSGDCCDNGGNLAVAALIFPGQTQFFAPAADICGIKWDYNCDGVETTECGTPLAPCALDGRSHCIPQTTTCTDGPIDRAVPYECGAQVTNVYCTGQSTPMPMGIPICASEVLYAFCH